MNSVISLTLLHLALLKDELSTGAREEQDKLRWKTVELLNKHFFLMLEKLGVESLYECGAHAAEASIKFSLLGKRAFAIEANPLIYREKTIKAEEFGVQTFNVLLDERVEKKDFNIQKVNPISGSSSTLISVLPKEVIAISLRTTKLDQIINRTWNKKDKIGLWIDVEGMGLEVLLGASQSLKSGNICIIKVEVESTPLWHNQKTAIDVESMLSGFGFVPVIMDLERAGQMNIVFIKSEEIGRIENQISAYFKELSQLRVNWLYKCFYRNRSRFRAYKLKNERTFSFHLVYALLGSKSSRLFIKARLKKRV
jgi:FkbM family methyltransferase